MYINTETMAYPLSEQDIMSLYPNTSFGIPFVPPEEYASVRTTVQPSYNPMYQGIKELTPVYVEPQEDSPVDGCWEQAWEVYDLTLEQIALNEKNAKQLNKNQASELLSQTDWTTIPDVSDPAVSNPYLTNAAEFAAYRSQIRAIAVYTPITVEVWPTKPDEQWSTV